MTSTNSPLTAAADRVLDLLDLPHHDWLTLADRYDPYAPDLAAVARTCAALTPATAGSRLACACTVPVSCELCDGAAHDDIEQLIDGAVHAAARATIPAAA